MLLADAASNTSTNFDCSSILLFLIIGIGYMVIKWKSMEERKPEVREPEDNNLGSWLKPKQYIPDPTDTYLYREDIYGQWTDEGKKLLSMDNSSLRTDWQPFIAFAQIRRMAVVRHPTSHTKLLHIDYDDPIDTPQVVGLALSDFGLRDWGMALEVRTGMWVENLEGRKKKPQEKESL